jgi:hypothetical protein
MKNTEKKQENLLKVLAQFALLNKRLPHAANPKSPKQEFGKEEEKLSVGLIPYHTLGIPESMTKDGYGNYFTYAMQPLIRKTEPAMIKRTDFCTETPVRPAIFLTENDQAIIPDPKAQKNDFVALVIVSHGTNGYGAYFGQPGQVEKRLHGIHGREEETNADKTGYFISRAKSYKQEDYFDDHVIWATRNVLASVYGGESCYSKKNTKPSKL